MLFLIVANHHEVLYVTGNHVPWYHLLAPYNCHLRFDTFLGFSKLTLIFFFFCDIGIFMITKEWCRTNDPNSSTVLHPLSVFQMFALKAFQNKYPTTVSRWYWSSDRANDRARSTAVRVFFLISFFWGVLHKKTTHVQFAPLLFYRTVLIIIIIICIKLLLFWYKFRCSVWRTACWRLSLCLHYQQQQ